jgi:4-methylaminobutanoate oxidase (formaldehyde-forming)
MTELPSQAEIVIVGGGIVGCAIAYHLTKRGKRDVLLLEQHSLTAGTTWHAAGLVGQLRSSQNLTRLARYAIDLYGKLEAETGQATGFKQNGGLTVARTPERMIELKRAASMARAFDVESHVVTPDEIRRLWPLLDAGRTVGGIWMPKDGQTSPVDTTQALAKGARMGGARIVEGVRVTRILTANGRATGVETARGRIAADAVVLAAGMWSRELARPVGVAVPLHAAEHMYVVTEPMAGIAPTTPVLRDYDGFLYAREDAGKLLFGAFEPEAKPWGMNGIPENHAFGVLPDDWEHFEPCLRNALQLIPSLSNIGIRQFFNGAESFTPDNRYMLGPAPELGGLYLATGLNSIGIASAPGIGRVLADWIVDGEAPIDLWDVDVSRYLPFQANPRYLRDRTVEALGLLYAMHWPYRQPETARGARRSPFHARQVAAGAQFGVVAGWERPLHYGPPAAPTYGAQPWWPHAAAEAKAARESVALFDQTPFAKLQLEGPDAERIVRRLCANDATREVGRAVYTQMLNARGGIEADLTVIRLASQRFLIVTSAASAMHDEAWIRRRMTGRAVLTDVSSAYAVVGVMGPQSRALLASLTDTDLSTAGFPWGAARRIFIGYGEALAVRMSYVGELGWELYVPTEFAEGVYEAIVAAGAAFGLRLAGLQAMDALRLEKGFKHWGHDIGPEDTPYEAGLGFAVRLQHEDAFIGKAALKRQQARGTRRRLCLFTLPGSTALLLHDEPIWRDGVVVGRTTSGQFGHTIGMPIAMGWVTGRKPIAAAWLNAGRYEIEVAGERLPARIHLEPPWDPRGARMRA